MRPTSLPTWTAPLWQEKRRMATARLFMNASVAARRHALSAQPAQHPVGGLRRDAVEHPHALDEPAVMQVPAVALDRLQHERRERVGRRRLRAAAVPLRHAVALVV